MIYVIDLLLTAEVALARAQGPVVQNFVSLTSPLRPQLVQ